MVNAIRNEMPLANLKEARTGQLFIVFQPFEAFVIVVTLYRIRAWIPLFGGGVSCGRAVAARVAHRDHVGVA